MYLKIENKKSSRSQIDIQGVNDNILVLSNNEYRAALSVGAINFELKSDAEQDNILDSYKSFLNSLPCPVQILIRIRSLDLNKYLERFKDHADAKQKHHHEQVEAYCGFVKKLVSTNKILSRNFYIVFPYNSPEELFIIKEQLNLRCDLIVKGLSKIGIQADRMSGLDILELFYDFYNPARAKSQPITNQTLELLRKASY